MRQIVPFALVFTVAVGLCSPSLAQAPAAKTATVIPLDTSPLGRYIPQAERMFYFELAGLDSQRDAWTKTNAYTLLAETKLGGMLEELGAQLINKLAATNPNIKISGSDAIALYKHIMKYGFVVAIGGESKDPNPSFATLVVRGGSRKDALPLFGKVIGGVTPPGSQSKGDKKNGRSVVQVTTPTKAVAVWWAEKGDLVFAFGQATHDSASAVMGAIDKKVPTMAESSRRTDLFAAKDGFVPVAIGYLEPVKGAPGAPPELGLAGLDLVDYRWGFQDNALMTVTRIVAPSPRTGLLAMFDQPSFSSDELPPLPGNLTGFTVISASPATLYDSVTKLGKAMSPDGGNQIQAFEAMVKDRTRLKLKEDILAHLGPKMAFYIAPNTGGSVLANALSIPKVVLVAEIDDSVAFGRALDELMIVVNSSIRDSVEKARDGAMAATNPADPATKGAAPPTRKTPTKRAGPVDPSIPNFRLVTGGTKSYVLDLPAGSFPVPLPGLKPTVRLGPKHLVIASSPEVARLALDIKPADQFKPVDAMATSFAKVPKGLIFLSISDPSGYLPATLVSLPTIASATIAQIEAQMSGKAAPGMPGGAGPNAAGNEMALSISGRPGGSGASGGPGTIGLSGGAAATGQPGAEGAAAGPVTIGVDPSKIPAVTDIAPKIFPATTSVSVDKTGITILTRESFPDLVSSSASTAVATALLLPAVQAARAAARRAAGLPADGAPGPAGLAPAGPGAVPPPAAPPGGRPRPGPAGAGGRIPD